MALSGLLPRDHVSQGRVGGIEQTFGEDHREFYLHG